MGKSDDAEGGIGWTPERQIDEFCDVTDPMDRVLAVSAFVASICKGDEYKHTLLLLAAEVSIRGSSRADFNDWMDGFIEEFGEVALEAWEFCRH